MPRYRSPAQGLLSEQVAKDLYCHRCTCDYRAGNNVGIEDMIHALGEEVALAFDVDERQPRNAYAQGAILHGGEQYKYYTHKKIDCDVCFNWSKMVEDEAKEAAKRDKWLEKRRKYLDKYDS